MAAMSQCNFEEQTSGSQEKKKKGGEFPRTRTLFFLLIADGPHSCGAVQSPLPTAGGGKWATSEGQRRTERMHPLLTQ